MNLSDRIKMILKENHLKQKDLAKELGVTESYISALLKGRNTNISQALASLIEEKFGYNSSWVLEGTEPKLKYPRANKALTENHKKAILKIERLQPEQIKAVLAFLNFLDNDDQHKYTN